MLIVGFIAVPAPCQKKVAVSVFVLSFFDWGSGYHGGNWAGFWGGYHDSQPNAQPPSPGKAGVIGFAECMPYLITVIGSNYQKL